MDSKIFKELLAKKGVVSVGRGHKKVGGVSTGRPCIVLGVTRKLPLADLSTQDIIPRVVGNSGEETDIVELGEIKLL